MEPPVLVMVVVPIGLSIVPLSTMSPTLRFSIVTRLGPTLRSRSKVSERTAGVPVPSASCSHTTGWRLLSTSMLLMTRVLVEVLVMRTCGSASPNSHRPLLPLMPLPVPARASSKARKTTSPAPGLPMSLTTMSVVSTSSAVCALPAASRTLALTALTISPRSLMMSSTSSRAERPERMRTSELNAMFCGRLSTVSPCVPPLASERLLTSGSRVMTMLPRLVVSTRKASRVTTLSCSRLGSVLLRGPATTRASAAPSTRLSRVVLLLASALTQPNKPEARAKDLALVLTSLARAMKSTPSRPVTTALAASCTRLSTGAVMSLSSSPSL